MTKVSRSGTAVLALLVVINLILTGSVYYSTAGLDNRVASLEHEQHQVTDYILVASDSASPATNISDTPGNQSVSVRRSTGALLAYDGQRNQGMVVPFNYQPLPGDTIYIDTSDVTVGQGTQSSIQNAQDAVATTSYEPATYGMAISMRAPKSWKFIEGQSAGLAIAIQIASTDPDYKLNKSVVATGVVKPDGRVNSVEHITEKARAAKKAGKKKILVPVTPAPVNVDGIRVVEVKTVQEALDQALVPVNEQQNRSVAG